MKVASILAAFLVCVSAGLGAVYLFLPSVLTWAAETALEQAGFEGASLRVASVGPTHIEVQDISLGTVPTWGAEKIQIAYSPGRLAKRIIDGITVTAPTVAIEVSASGIDLGPLDRATDDGQGGAWRLIGPFQFEQATVNVTSPFGEIAAALNGEVTLTDGLGTATAATFSLTHPQADLAGKWQGVIGEDGVGRLQFDITDARSAARLAFAKLTGAVELSGRFPDGLAGQGQLTLDDAVADTIPLGNVDVGASLADGVAVLSLLVGGDALGVTLDASARTPRLFDPASIIEVQGTLATDGFRGPLAEISPIDALGAVGFSLQGSRLAVQGLLDGLPLGQISAPEQITGWIEASQLSVRGVAQETDAQVDGLIDFVIGSGGWEMQPVGDVTIDVNAVIDGDAHSLLAALGTVEDTVFARGAADLKGPIQLAGTFDALVDQQVHLIGDFGGNAWFANGVRFEEMAARLSPLGVKADALDVVIDSATLRFNGPLQDLRTSVILESRISGDLSARIRVAGAQLSAVGDVIYRDDVLRLRSNACLNAQIAELTVDGRELASGPMQLCPNQNNAPLVEVKFVDGVPTLLTVQGDVPTMEIADVVIEDHTFSGLIPRLSGSFTFDLLEDTWWTDVAASGGRLNVAPLNFTLAGVDAQITAEGRERLLGLRMETKSLRLIDGVEPARLAPLAVSGLMDFAGETLSFDGAAKLGPGPSIEIAARHRLQDTRGWLSATLPAWQMIEDQPPIETLFPVLQGVATAAMGEVEAEARLDWSARGLASRGKISLSEAGVDFDVARIRGAEVDMELSSLWPLTTVGDQVLRIATVDPGIPFNWGEIRFSLPGDDTLKITEAAWPLAGGTIRLRDVLVPFAEPPDRLVADLVDMDATVMIDMLDVDGLEADGLMDGIIPIVLGDDGPTLDNARLVAKSGGQLRYRSPGATDALAASGGSTEILARALEDFRYTDLELSINGPLSGDLTASAQIRGANPALYDGKRIELNVRLTGALRELLQSASVLNNIPGAVRDRVQDPAGTQRRTQ